MFVLLVSLSKFYPGLGQIREQLGSLEAVPVCPYCRPSNSIQALMTS